MFGSIELGPSINIYFKFTEHGWLLLRSIYILRSDMACKPNVGNLCPTLSAGCEAFRLICRYPADTVLLPCSEKMRLLMNKRMMIGAEEGVWNRWDSRQRGDIFSHFWLESVLLWKCAKLSPSTHIATSQRYLVGRYSPSHRVSDGTSPGGGSDFLGKGMLVYSANSLMENFLWLRKTHGRWEHLLQWVEV